MWTRADLKERGKGAFKRNYWPAVGISVMMAIISGLFTSSGRLMSGPRYSGGYSGGLESNYSNYSSTAATVFTLAFIIILLIIVIVSLFANILLVSPLTVGVNRFFMENREAKPKVEMIFYAFKSGKYVNVVKTLLLQNIFIFLWTLLLVVPGIIKSYQYRMIPYILSENPGMEWKQAFEISKQMMNGQKMNTFILDLSFILWGLLSLITCGIVATFYVNPYIFATRAELYAVLRAHALYQGGLTTRELPGYGSNVLLEF